MAKERLSAATFVTRGYGQVEPNHLSGQKTGRLYAQLPLGIDKLENGQFAKYDYKTNTVNLEGDGEWFLHFSEVKVYEARETEEDFVITKGGVYPRLVGTLEGDVYTTNTVNGTKETLTEGKILTVGADGFLAVNDAPEDTDMQWQIAKVYTMPDGQPGLKLVRIN